VINTTPSSVSALTFNLVPAKIGQMALNGVTVNGGAASTSLDDMNVIVHLNSALAPNGSADVTIRYSAHFNSTNPNRKWLFAERHDIVTAYRWIPWLSQRATFKTPLFGDAFTTQVASRVDVSITADRAGMTYAAPGTRTSVSGNTQTFVAYNVRDLNFTASPDYHVVTETHGGVEFDYYTIDLAQAAFAKYAKQAFDKYVGLVGAYPYSKMFVAEISPGFAMESPQGFWIPESYGPADVKFAVIHEVGHQWYYAAVGSNQATEPFADEAWRSTSRAQSRASGAQGYLRPTWTGRSTTTPRTPTTRSSTSKARTTSMRTASASAIRTSTPDCAPTTRPTSGRWAAPSNCSRRSTRTRAAMAVAITRASPASSRPGARSPGGRST
jgi:hypothetical protein